MKKFFVSTLLIVSCFQLLADPITWTSPPDVISTLGVDSTDPQVVMDGAGNATAAWVENGAIVVKTKLNGLSWGAPTTISVLSGSSAPRLAVTPDNGVAIAWLEPTGIASARFRAAPGGAWSVVRTLSGAGASSPVLAGDNNNNFVAAWVLGTNVQSSTKLSGGVWQVVPDTLTGTAPTLPDVGMNNDTVVVVWHDTVAGVEAIYSANKTISGATWSSPAAISNSSINATNPKVVVDLTGVGHATWFSYDFDASFKFSGVGIQYALFPTSKTWGTPTSVSGNGIYDPNLLYISINVDSVGNTIIYWNTSSNGSTFLVQTVSFLSSTVPPAFFGRSVSDETQYTLALDSTATPNGNVYLTHMFYDPDLTKICIAALQTQSILTGVSESTNLSNIANTNPDAYPQIAAAQSGSDLITNVVWEDFNGTNKIIMSSAGSGGVPAPPTTALVSKDSDDNGVFVEYFNTLTWTATSDPSVVGYSIYRNGLQIAILGSDVTLYTDHNRPPSPGNTGNYMIAAVFPDGSTSVFATVTY